jgi:hypothetical protein
MNCRFAPIDARPCGLMLTLVGTRTQKRVALHHHHCPEEGSGGSS